MKDKALIEVVARCLAKHGGFISACEWKTNKGDKYRDCATNVLQTIENYNQGNNSGGLPPNISPLSSNRIGH